MAWPNIIPDITPFWLLVPIYTENYQKCPLASLVKSIEMINGRKMT